MVGTASMTWYYLSRFARNSTPTKIANVVMAKSYKQLRRDRLVSMPYRYTIDPTNTCNLRCPLCPTGLGILGRERGLMKMADFQHVVDEIAPWCYLLELYNWGEPFLHPGIFDMINYAYQRKIVVRLSSNLNHFNPEMAGKTVDAGLGCIIVSVDGATEESYQSYRRRGRLETVLRNLRYLVDAKRSRNADHPFIMVRMLMNRYNEREVETLRTVIMDIGADIFVAGDLFIDTTNAAQRQEWLPLDAKNSPYDYQEGDSGQQVIENVWHCSDLWESMTINWDGGVAPCCWLHKHEHDFANALQQPVREIWNGAAYVSARRVFALGGSRTGPQNVICTTCRGRPQYLKI
jgi:MoaA/NifB/PqqE/SkfB family radical SAM enzyme